jgi:asparagine synthase (glutamine-hydrolysing)
MLSSYLMLRALFSPEAVAVLTGGASTDGSGRFEEEDRGLRTRIQELDRFRQVSLLEMEMYMANMLLRDTDVMSMAHSLEVRVPFLDHRLVEYVWSLPMLMKRRAGRPKSLLVEALGRDLPKAVVSRPKMGFAFPWPKWMRGALRTAIGDTFASESSSGNDVVDRRECLRLLTKFLSGSDDHNWSRVWALYVLCRWLDRLRAGKKPGEWAVPACQCGRV